jgi:hypothetical protein
MQPATTLKLQTKQTTLALYTLYQHMHVLNLQYQIWCNNTLVLHIHKHGLNLQAIICVTMLVIQIPLALQFHKLASTTICFEFAIPL